MIEFISQAWHWSVSGLLISIVMFLLLYQGKKFGVSSSFVAICSMVGAGKKIEYFNVDWKSYDWLILFVIGSIVGGYIASQYLAAEIPVQVSVETKEVLAKYSIDVPQNFSEGQGFVPVEIFGISNVLTVKGFMVVFIGGFFIGLGTRWAGGCTSGHAISGLSNLQLPSLIAVIGFFIGGLILTHLLFPLIF